MLPLLSTSIPIDKGTSSRRNNLIGCSTLSSYTLNADFGTFVISFPLLSTTLTCNVTSLSSVWKVGVSSCARACVWTRATANTAPPSPIRSFLLCRCNIAWTIAGPQRGQFLNFDQFDFHFSILAVMRCILRVISQHVLIAKLQTD